MCGSVDFALSIPGMMLAWELACKTGYTGEADNLPIQYDIKRMSSYVFTNPGIISCLASLGFYDKSKATQSIIDMWFGVPVVS